MFMWLYIVTAEGVDHKTDAVSGDVAIGKIVEKLRTTSMPVTSGFQWVYRVTGDSGIGYHHAQEGRLEVRVEGISTIKIWEKYPDATREITAWKIAGGWFGANYLVFSKESIQIYTTITEEGGVYLVGNLIADFRWGNERAWQSGPPQGYIGHIEGKLVSSESLTISAGSFDTVVIEQMGDFWHSTAWIAPKVGIVKYRVRRRWGNETKEELWELKSFGSNNKPN